MSQRPWTRLLGIDRWFECRSCGQLVRGWRASEDIRCCENKQLVEIFPLVSLDDIHEQALKEHAVYVNKVTKLKVQRDELLAACISNGMAADEIRYSGPDMLEDAASKLGSEYPDLALNLRNKARHERAAIAKARGV